MITNRAQDEDDVDAGFEAEDDFARPAIDHENLPSAWDAPDALSDEPQVTLADHEQDPDPFGVQAGLHPAGEGDYGEANPVGEMIAGAEAAFASTASAGEASVPRISIHIFCERSETATIAAPRSSPVPRLRSTSAHRLRWRAASRCSRRRRAGPRRRSSGRPP